MITSNSWFFSLSNINKCISHQTRDQPKMEEKQIYIDKPDNNGFPDMVKFQGHMSDTMDKITHQLKAWCVPGIFLERSN